MLAQPYAEPAGLEGSAVQARGNASGARGLERLPGQRETGVDALAVAGRAVEHVADHGVRARSAGDVVAAGHDPDEPALVALEDPARGIVSSPSPPSKVLPLLRSVSSSLPPAPEIRSLPTPPSRWFGPSLPVSVSAPKPPSTPSTSGPIRSFSPAAPSFRAVERDGHRRHRVVGGQVGPLAAADRVAARAAADLIVARARVDRVVAVAPVDAVVAGPAIDLIVPGLAAEVGREAAGDGDRVVAVTEQRRELEPDAAGSAPGARRRACSRRPA